jgi:2TM domain
MIHPDNLNSSKSDYVAMVELTLEAYKRAYRTLTIEREKKGFIVHLIAYVGVNSILIALNLLFDPEFTWFVFPLVGWGAGLASHYIFGVHLAPKYLEKDEISAERLALSKS